MTDSVPLVFIDDEGLVAGALVTVMTAGLVESGFEVLPLAATVADVGPVTSLGVAVCDVSLRRGPGGAQAAEVLIGLGWRVLLMSGRASADAVLDAIGVGARGYVEKIHDDRDALFTAVIDVAAHGWYLGPALAELFYPDLLRHPLPAGAELSTMDRQVLRQITQGDDRHRVAQDCGLTEPELRSAIRRIFAAAVARRPHHQLTGRERQVVVEIGCGLLETKEAARRLGMEVTTMNSHLRAIRDKYRQHHPHAADLSPRAAAQIWARELDLCADNGTGDGAADPARPRKKP